MKQTLIALALSSVAFAGAAVATPVIMIDNFEQPASTIIKGLGSAQTPAAPTVQSDSHILILTSSGAPLANAIQQRAITIINSGSGSGTTVPRRTTVELDPVNTVLSVLNGSLVSSSDTLINYGNFGGTGVDLTSGGSSRIGVDLLFATAGTSLVLQFTDTASQVATATWNVTTAITDLTTNYFSYGSAALAGVDFSHIKNIQIDINTNANGNVLFHEIYAETPEIDALAGTGALTLLAGALALAGERRRRG